MSPQQLAITIEQLVLDADERYAIDVSRIQARLYNQLVAILKNLELTHDGYIKQNSSNRKILLQADRKIRESFMAPSYPAAVSKYVSEITAIDAASITYFSAFPAFKENRIFLKQIQQEAIATVEKYVLQDGLMSQVITPLENILVQNINAGGSFTGFIDQLKQYVKGDGNVEGRILNYTRTYIRDSIFTYSRVYQQAVSSDLGLEYYLYSGGLIDTSRDFCQERAGQYFHKKEIEAWAGLEWKGKKKDTTKASIFQFAGGWNCAHQIIPVSEAVVPEEVKKRSQ